MGVMQRQRLGIREISETVTAPQNPVARAMFYLKCICNVVDLTDRNNNLQKLTDFRNYHLLTEDDIDALTMKPSALLGKCLFPDEEICGSSNDKFFELEDVRQNMVIVNDVLIAGQRRQVIRIMFYKRAWMDLYCLSSLRWLRDRLARRKALLDARRRQANPSHQTTSSYCAIL